MPLVNTIKDNIASDKNYAFLTVPLENKKTKNFIVSYKLKRKSENELPKHLDQ